MSQWRWGREHVALLQHKVYSHIPLLDRISDLSMPSSGGFYTLDRGGGFDTPADQPYARTHGGGYRAIYDLADPDKSRFVIATGESGHIFSPHYRDLAPLWIEGKSITLAGDEDGAEARRRAGADLHAASEQRHRRVWPERPVGSTLRCRFGERVAACVCWWWGPVRPAAISAGDSPRRGATSRFSCARRGRRN